VRPTNIVFSRSLCHQNTIWVGNTIKSTLDRTLLIHVKVVKYGIPKGLDRNCFAWRLLLFILLI
jgi:hypothetical protein